MSNTTYYGQLVAARGSMIAHAATDMAPTTPLCSAALARPVPLHFREKYRFCQNCKRVVDAARAAGRTPAAKRKHPTMSIKNPTQVIDGVAVVFQPPCCHAPDRHINGMCPTPHTAEDWKIRARYCSWQASRPEGSTTISQAHYAEWAHHYHIRAAELLRNPTV